MPPATCKNLEQKRWPLLFLRRHSEKSAPLNLRTKSPDEQKSRRSFILLTQKTILAPLPRGPGVTAPFRPLAYGEAVVNILEFQMSNKSVKVSTE